LLEIALAVGGVATDPTPLDVPDTITVVPVACAIVRGLKLLPKKAP